MALIGILVLVVREFIVTTIQHGINLANVLILNKSDIPLFWDHIKGNLSLALNESKWCERYPIKTLYSDLISGELVCWIVFDGEIIKGVAVTQNVEYPLGDSLLVFLLGGNEMTQWADDLHNEFVRYAKKQGHKWIDACARHGLGKKYLHGLGFATQNNHYCYEVSR